MATAVLHAIRGDQTTMTPPPRAKDSWYEDRILEKIAELGVKLDSVRAQVTAVEVQGRENGVSLQLLRGELFGADGRYGRIPQLEAEVKDLRERDLKDIKEKDLKELKDGFARLERRDTMAQGRQQFVTIAISTATSTGAVALLGWLAHQLGFFH